ncbi:hypothetical protein TSUD_381370, partial [Trifolium subterraneum]
IFGVSLNIVEGKPSRILLDTDVDTDDFFALLYLLKLNRSEFKLEGVTVNANAWTNAGHAVNQIYDLLYMMGRDDIAVGVGGEGGILPNGRLDVDTNLGIRKAFLPQNLDIAALIATSDFMLKE